MEILARDGHDLDGHDLDGHGLDGFDRNVLKSENVCGEEVTNLSGG